MNVYLILGEKEDSELLGKFCSRAEILKGGLEAAIQALENR